MGFWDDLFACCGGADRGSAKDDYLKRGNARGAQTTRILSKEDEQFLEKARQIADREAERKKKIVQVNASGKIVSAASWEDVLPESTLGRNNGLSAGDELTFEVQNPLHRSEHSFNEDDDDIFNANNGSVSSESLKPSDGPADAQPTFSDVLSSDALYGNFGTTTEYVNPYDEDLEGKRKHVLLGTISFRTKYQ